jgi:hypothetical protein
MPVDYMYSNLPQTRNMPTLRLKLPAGPSEACLDCNSTDFKWRPGKPLDEPLCDSCYAARTDCDIIASPKVLVYTSGALLYRELAKCTAQTSREECCKFCKAVPSAASPLVQYSFRFSFLRPYDDYPHYSGLVDLIGNRWVCLDCALHRDYERWSGRNRFRIVLNGREYGQEVSLVSGFSRVKGASETKLGKQTCDSCQREVPWTEPMAQYQHDTDWRDCIEVCRECSRHG